MPGLWKTWRDRRRCPCSQRSDRLVGSRDEHRRQRDLATPRLRGSRRPGLARAVDPSSGCTAGLWPAHSLVVCAKARGWRDDRRWGSRGRGSASLPCRATRYPVGAKRDRSRAATGHPGGILGERVAPSGGAPSVLPRRRLLVPIDYLRAAIGRAPQRPRVPIRTGVLVSSGPAPGGARDRRLEGRGCTSTYERRWRQWS
jgi:hypothetical protein